MNKLLKYFYFNDKGSGSYKKINKYYNNENLYNNLDNDYILFVQKYFIF